MTFLPYAIWTVAGQYAIYTVDLASGARVRHVASYDSATDAFWACRHLNGARKDLL